MWVGQGPNPKCEGTRDQHVLAASKVKVTKQAFSVVVAVVIVDQGLASASWQWLRGEPLLGRTITSKTEARRATSRQ